MKMLQVEWFRKEISISRDFIWIPHCQPVPVNKGCCCYWFLAHDFRTLEDQYGIVAGPTSTEVRKVERGNWCPSTPKRLSTLLRPLSCDVCLLKDHWSLFKDFRKHLMIRGRLQMRTDKLWSVQVLSPEQLSENGKIAMPGERVRGSGTFKGTLRDLPPISVGAYLNFERAFRFSLFLLIFSSYFYIFF